MEHATRAADILALSDTPETKNVRIAKPDKSNVNEVEGYTDQDRRSLQAAVLITLAIGYTLGKKYPLIIVTIMVLFDQQVHTKMPIVLYHWLFKWDLNQYQSIKPLLKYGLIV